MDSVILPNNYRTMDLQTDIRAAIQQLFQEPSFLAKLQELLAPGIEGAVSKALELRDAKIAALEAELASTKDKLEESEEQLCNIEKQVELLEAESRKNCLVVSGVPELPEENTDQLVLDIAKAAGVEMSTGDIDRSHRLGRQNGTIERPRTILLKLLSSTTRQRLFSARKELSAHRVRDHPVLTPHVLENVFMTDFLTSKSQQLLFICRQLRRRELLWAAYSSNGRIKVKVAENQPPRMVSSLADLQSLIGPDNAVLREILQSAAQHSHGQTTAAATGGAGPRGDAASPAAPHQAGRAAGLRGGGFKARIQPARGTGHQRR